MREVAIADAIRIRVAPVADALLVEIVDDGSGGADPASGTGLRGLADRVDALDGLLEIESPPGPSSRSWTRVSSHASRGNGRSAIVRRELASASRRRSGPTNLQRRTMRSSGTSSRIFVSAGSEEAIRNYRARMGWADWPWYTTLDDFSADFDVSEWFGTNEELPGGRT